MSAPLVAAIRSAHPTHAESDRLADLAVAAGIGWHPTNPAYVAFVRKSWEYLRPSPEFIRTNPVFVLEVNAALVGFCAIRRHPAHPIADADIELLDLFIHPQWQRQGYGARLWARTVATARSLQRRCLMVESHPDALPFYLKQGCQQVGERLIDADLPFICPVVVRGLAERGPL
jgi:GNAT superfamily N-acetyltransferase